VSDPTRDLKQALRTKAAELHVPLDVLEKDYALSYTLSAIYQDESLASSLVFKGGTSLRKAYFPDYRFSVDLDFSATSGPRGEEMEAAVERVAAAAERALLERGPFRVTSGRRSERAPHPGAQEAFQVRVQFPWQSQPHCIIKIEITTDEAILLPPRSLPLLHPYAEDLSCLLVCYSLEEMVAEKLRTPLQAQKRADEGRWLRNCARDYYDLWYLTSPGRALVDQNVVATILRQKAAARDVDFHRPDDFFPPAVLVEAERQWRSSLADLVAALPDFEAVIGELEGWMPGVLTGAGTESIA
jgi:uncharacterized protein